MPPPISFIDIIGAFRGFVEELPVMVYAVEALPPYSPIYVSPALRLLLGYPLEEWTTNREMWKHVIHPEDQAGVFLRPTHPTPRAKRSTMNIASLPQTAASIGFTIEAVLSAT